MLMVAKRPGVFIPYSEFLGATSRTPERLSAAQIAVGEKTKAYARQYGIDERIMYWMVYHESRFIPTARNPQGAGGLGQFVPSTWRQYGNGKNVLDADANLDAMGRYLRDLLRMYAGRYDYSLISYANGGGAVNDYKAGRAIPYQAQEFKDFVLSKAQSQGFNGTTGGGSSTVAASSSPGGIVQSVASSAAGAAGLQPAASFASEYAAPLTIGAVLLLLFIRS